MFTKRYLSVLIFISAVVNISFADHHNAEDIPQKMTEFSPAFRVAAIAGYKNWDLQMSTSGEYRTDSPDLYKFQTLLYYRLLKNLKAGLFYTLQKGERHDDDWISEGGGWFWKDSSQRFEHLVGADITPRFLLPFLPGENWLISSRTRYSYNLYNDQQKLLFRPELSYFHMKNRRPLWSISSAYALYFSLNFGETLIYEHGPYLSLNFHTKKNIIFSLTGDYSVKTWSSSESYKAAGAEYQVDEQRFTAGASIIWKIDIPDKKS